ncbi:hypothetical protein SKAU_G00222980 [Synaphobranchus kaupii]|uniref:CD79a n=1 Tax=Synaphobranchus kaupii TaxID=118154 RepID=A0A9Q1FB47_SYNKA|nr:hypothetical protein SKAU_G00222980 [Synaphobranchus kaupii]
MISRSILLLLWYTGVTHGNLALVTLYKDRPLLRAMALNTAELECCYEVKGVTVEPIWVVSVIMTNGTKRYLETTQVAIDDQRVTPERAKAPKEGLPCYILKVREVDMNDTGLYRCLLNHTSLYSYINTHGTFLQVYKPMPKFLNISEKAKNSIILTEAILLLLCVLVPGIPLLCKTKKQNKQEKKKGEEENIYEGLNLDDFDSTYHQIQRSQVFGPYQDVGNVLGEDIQLEKP